MPVVGDLKPTPLPPNPFPATTEHASAYGSCLTLESRDNWGVLIDDLQPGSSHSVMFDTMSPVVAARVLGYTLIHAPTEKGRDSIARDIESCHDDLEHLAGLAFLYIHGLVRIFRNPEMPTRDVSADQSRLVVPGPTPATLKDKILARENYECAFSKIIDKESFRNHLMILPPGAITGRTQVAHIISQSLTDGIAGISEAAKLKHNWASSAGAILDRFAGIEIQALLGPLDLHNPINAFLAWAEPHATFDELRMFFVPAKDPNGNTIPNTYDICVISNDDKCINMRKQITFRECLHNNVPVPPPSAKLLELHTACVRIAHMSGAADLLESYDRPIPPFKGLATSSLSSDVNSSAADALVFALRRIPFASRPTSASS
ncbi:hypothetical protein B0H12DRAFT_1233352 [Mycena haematopus]|nr:hypothetical protein B0H12DRAFT_1233352 [Mycena haematopus]